MSNLTKLEVTQETNADCCERLVPGFQRPNLCDFLLDEKKFQRVPRDVTTDGARVTNAKSSSPLP